MDYTPPQPSAAVTSVIRSMASSSSSEDTRKQMTFAEFPRRSLLKRRESHNDKKFMKSASEIEPGELLAVLLVS